MQALKEKDNPRAFSEKLMLLVNRGGQINKICCVISVKLNTSNFQCTQSHVHVHVCDLFLKVWTAVLSQVQSKILSWWPLSVLHVTTSPSSIPLSLTWLKKILPNTFCRECVRTLFCPNRSIIMVLCLLTCCIRFLLCFSTAHFDSSSTR